MKYLFIVEKCAMTVCVVIKCMCIVPALQTWVREVKVKKSNKIAIKKEFLLILILFFLWKLFPNKFFPYTVVKFFFVFALSLTWHIHCCRIENLNAKILFMLVSCFSWIFFQQFGILYEILVYIDTFDLILIKTFKTALYYSYFHFQVISIFFTFKCHLFFFEMLFIFLYIDFKQR